MKILVTDVPNIFFRTTSASTNSKYIPEDADKANLALHSCLYAMNKWYNQRKPDMIVVVFEGKRNWRKAYTSSENCISGALYKGNRVKDPAMEHLFQVLNDFEKLAREHTSFVVLSKDELEGDDLIAGCAKRFSEEGHEVEILSGDKDFVQLLKYNSVSIINPDKNKTRECDDPNYFIFEKCIRGDTGDNVRSAFPRVRSTRLQKAYSDPYEMTLLMNERWKGINPTTEQEVEFRVGDLFEENKLLMDLDHQPDDIKALIQQTIEEGLNSQSKFSLFAFTKFLGQHGLNNIAENSERFVKLLSCKPQNEMKNPSVLKF
jgi:5'-3' exonuclease